MSPSRLQTLYGTDEPPAQSRMLKAGALQVEFADGNLRHISWHGYEALRAISYLVRDENWGTHSPAFSDVMVEETPDRFEISYTAACRSDSGAILKNRATIAGHADGRVVFDVVATPDSDFPTNRCGFCVLHPIIGVAGTTVDVEHGDGSVESSTFPTMIDPAQPFHDMRSIRHEVTRGVTALCRMEGDVFEMEDQRNWSDASFKTYVRPLALPWPYRLPAGKPMRQTVSLTLGGVPASRPRRTDAVEVSLGERFGLAPAFGLVLTPEETALTLYEIDRLREIAPRHLILTYSPGDGHGLESLVGFARVLEAFPAESTLEFVLPCVETPAAECDDLRRALRAAGLRPSAIAVSPAPDLKSTPPGSPWPACPPLEEVYAAARTAFPDMSLGGGMFTYFTELNRKRPPAHLLDFITHTTSPLVHAADDRSVMETLEALPFITGSVRAIFGDKPYRIGPSSIGMRHNPYGARLADNSGAQSRMTMTAEDPRQKGLFAAAWMIGYAAAVSKAGLTHLSLGSLTGAQGALGEGGAPRPAFFSAKALASLSGKTLRAATSSDPAKAVAVAAGDTVVLANLTPNPVTLRLPGLSRVSIFDEDSPPDARRHGGLKSEAVHGSVKLGAYGIAIGSVGAL